MKVDVLLIHPPVNFNLTKRPAISSFIIGYGMLYVAACLVQRGYSVIVWNLEQDLASDISQQDIEKELSMLDPSVVGIEMNWANFSRGTIQTAEILKKARPDLPIIVGGTHATLFSKEIVQRYRRVIDGVLKGEAEKTFPEIVEDLEETGSIGEVGGLVSLKDGHLCEVPLKKEDLYDNIDDIPPYSYKVIRHVKPNTSIQFPAAHVAINTCRGRCRLSCEYCIGRHIAPLSGRPSFSIHSPDWIIEQMSLLKQEGATGFLFQDYLYTVGKQHLMKIVSALREERVCENVMGINMTAMPGSLDGETLEELSSAGVYNIDYGVESGSDRILKLLNRPTSRAKILDAVGKTISKGIIPYTWWMTGLPDEGSEEIKETLDLMNKTTELGAIPRWVTPLTVYPGTELYRRPRHYGLKLKLKSFEDFTVFSELEENIAAWHPQAVSHETEHLDSYGITRAAFDLRFEAFRKKEEIVENFMKKYAKNINSYHPQIPGVMLETMINEDIRALLTNFL
jgi:radical SAM superfamily enzyme YgiQ (UPF0313 family)